MNGLLPATPLGNHKSKPEVRLQSFTEDETYILGYPVYVLRTYFVVGIIVSKHL